MNDDKHECWDLDVLVSATYRFVFDEPVTYEQAVARASDGDYEDVIDEKDITIVEVIG